MPFDAIALSETKNGRKWLTLAECVSLYSHRRTTLRTLRLLVYAFPTL